MSKLQTVLTATLLVVGTSAVAGICSGSGSPSLLAGSSFGSATVHTRSFSTDRNYRMGRVAFSKRTVTGEKIRYCVMVNGEAKRITKTRLRALRGSSIDEFALSLVDCNDLAELALAKVEEREKIPHILYYLAAHYEVSLARLSPEERLARLAARELENAVASVN